jgi:hypothetical protein
MRKVIEAKLAGIVENIRARKPFYNWSHNRRVIMGAAWHSKRCWTGNLVNYWYMPTFLQIIIRKKWKKKRNGERTKEQKLMQYRISTWGSPYCTLNSSFTVLIIQRPLFIIW